MTNLNSNKMAAVVAEAKAKVTGQAKWVRAIDRAVEMLESSPYWNYADGELLVLGSEGECYRANGSCQCAAYRQGMAHCKHRVAAKLLKIYTGRA